MDRVPTFFDSVLPYRATTPSIANIALLGVAFPCDFLWSSGRVLRIVDTDHGHELQPLLDQTGYRKYIYLALKVCTLALILLVTPGGITTGLCTLAIKIAYRTYLNAYYISQIPNPNAQNNPQGEAMALVPVEHNPQPQQEPDGYLSMLRHVPGVSSLITTTEQRRQRELQAIRNAINENIQDQLTNLVNRHREGTAIIGIQFSDQKSTSNEEETFTAAALLRVTVVPGEAQPQVEGIQVTYQRENRQLLNSSSASSDNSPSALTGGSASNTTSTALTIANNQDYGTALIRALPGQVLRHMQCIRSATIMRDQAFSIYDSHTEEEVTGSGGWSLFRSGGGAFWDTQDRPELINQYVETLRMPILVENRHLWEANANQSNPSSARLQIEGESTENTLPPRSTVVIEDVTDEE